jgi:hypothetical protein
LKLTTLLKLIHILRLSKIINNIRLSESKKIVIRIAQIVLSVVMYVHCIGCAWVVLVEIKEKWMPPSEGAASDFYATDDEAKKYSFSLYHAVYMWAGVEINPQSNLEMFYLILVIIVGSIIRAVLFGKMAILMSGLNKDSARISAILDTVSTSMKNMLLPEALQLKSTTTCWPLNLPFLDKRSSSCSCNSFLPPFRLQWARSFTRRLPLHVLCLRNTLTCSDLSFRNFASSSFRLKPN